MCYFLASHPFLISPLSHSTSPDLSLESNYPLPSVKETPPRDKKQSLPKQTGS